MLQAFVSFIKINSRKNLIIENLNQHGGSTHIYYWRTIKILIKIVFAEKFQTQGNFGMTMKEIKDLREFFFYA